MTITLEQIEQRVLAYNASADFTALHAAYDFAARSHEGQMRNSGEPFISHPMEVVGILAELHLDMPTLIAGMLHDTVEDSSATVDEVRAAFGDEVAALVDGVTKLGKIKFDSRDEAQSQNLRKMLIAMAKDIRVILIKLADRLHNMRTIEFVPPERQREKAIETRDIYAPLAHRLGISQVKWSLEDLSFKVLEPQKYQQIQRLVADSRNAREAYLKQVIDELTKALDEVGIKAEISGRPKHFYSIYQKMSQKGKDFNEIYDLIALRIIVDSVKDCYGALGTVHSMWKPVPGRFKDYVAMPKFNMYQSLHTTVIGPAGRPLELQIRTEEMHRTAEYGIAAHWRYKEGGGRSDETFDERLAWLRQMLEWQTELKDPREFMEALKIDLFEDEVFVFTPKGDVVSLRKGSTPIDFAYNIHTEVGNHTVGAKVNGSIVPLGYELQMGDRVEIMTNKNSQPSRDWLNIVRTSSARSKIRSFFSKASRTDDFAKGKDELQKILRKQGLSVGSSAGAKALLHVAKEMNFTEADDLVAHIGAGKVSAKLIVGKLIKLLAGTETAPEVREPELAMTTPMLAPRARRRKSPTGVRVKGIDDLLVRLAHCCNPVPGDPIVGFVTRGRGVSVHRADCPNAKDLLNQPERIIEVEWDTGASTTYQVEIYIEARDRTGLLRDITLALAEAGVNVMSANIATDKQGIATMRFLFELGNMEQLGAVLQRVRHLDGVFAADRMMPSPGGPRT
jgi:GTP diphosphokinase / guanosine-3',5'-bis(diphosphate) 3'-diphosphatase